MDDSSYLPIFRRSGTRQSRRESPVSGPRSSSPPLHKWIHAIPLIVLLSFFILWWFSHPVNLAVKDGRIEEIHPIKIPLNDTTYVELATLASATSPIGSIPQILTGNNETEAHPMSKND